MRKTIVCGVALAFVATPSAFADKPDSKDKKPPKSPYACVPQNVGYNASGTLVSASLTQTAGADTSQRGDDRYSGQMTVDVRKANHKGAKGAQTYTLTDARVKFHPRNDTDVAAGDRVKVHGKVTKLAKKCDTTGFTPTVTVRKVDVKAAKAPKQPKA